MFENIPYIHLKLNEHHLEGDGTIITYFWKNL